jgi:hypothetical protein
VEGRRRPVGVGGELITMLQLHVIKVQLLHVSFRYDTSKLVDSNQRADMGSCCFCSDSVCTIIWGSMLSISYSND